MPLVLARWPRRSPGRRRQPYRRPVTPAMAARRPSHRLIRSSSGTRLRRYTGDVQSAYSPATPGSSVGDRCRRSARRAARRRGGARAGRPRRSARGRSGRARSRPPGRARRAAGALSRMRRATSAHAVVVSRGGRPRLGWLTERSLAPGPAGGATGQAADARTLRLRLRRVTDTPATARTRPRPRIAGERRLARAAVGALRRAAPAARHRRPRADATAGRVGGPRRRIRGDRGDRRRRAHRRCSAERWPSRRAAGRGRRDRLCGRPGHGRSGRATRCRAAARPWVAAGLAALGVVLGQVGLWLFARTEGGVLPLVDYLGQTFGPLVPLEVLLAAGVAWWRAR